MSIVRSILLVFALMLVGLATPALAAPAPIDSASAKLATYTHPEGVWSVKYPAGLLHAEQLSADLTLLISKDRHTFVAVEVFDAAGAVKNDVMLGRGQAVLRQVYGKNVKNTGVLKSPGARWAAGFAFTTDKGSQGEAVYHQNGRGEGSYRLYGVAYGYKSADAQAMLPVLQAVRDSLQIWPAAPRRIDRARDSLRAYFGALHAGRYAAAAALYGGSYDLLSGWNPDVAPRDHAKLFALGCGQNGLRCLRLKRVIGETSISPTEFNFVVEFLNDDGSTFKRGPCCGETSGPIVTRFPFNVRKVGGTYLVQDLPVYVP